MSEVLLLATLTKWQEAIFQDGLSKIITGKWHMKQDIHVWRKWFVKLPWLSSCLLTAMAALFFVLSMACLQAASQQVVKIYKYTDKQGKIHFDYQPPKNERYEVIEKKQPFSAGRVPEVQQGLNEELDDNVQSPNQAPSDHYTQQLNQLENERVKACREARENKRILLNTVRVSVKQPDGTEKVLTREEKVKKLEAADQAIKYYCADDMAEEGKSRGR